MIVEYNKLPEVCPYCGGFPALKHKPEWKDYAIKYTCGCSCGAAFPQDIPKGRTFNLISYEWDTWARHIKEGHDITAEDIIGKLEVVDITPYRPKTLRNTISDISYDISSDISEE